MEYKVKKENKKERKKTTKKIKISDCITKEEESL
jgi:hypothetical protein